MKGVMSSANKVALRNEFVRLFIPLGTTGNSNRGMTWAEFNAFTKDIVGIELQKRMSKFIGYDLSVDNALRIYARETKKPHDFFCLVCALRNRRKIRGTWKDEDEEEYRRLVGLVPEEYKDSFAPWDEDELGGKGYSVYDRIRDERHDAKSDQLLAGQADIKQIAQQGKAAAEEVRDKLCAYIDSRPEREKREIKKASKAQDPSLTHKDMATYALWKKWTDGRADPEVIGGGYRAAGGKRSLDEFFAVCKRVKVWNGHTLGEIYPDVDEVKRAIERERKRRERATAAPPPQTPPCPTPW